MAKPNKVVNEFTKQVELGMSKTFLAGFIRALEVSGKNIEANRCKKLLPNEERTL